MWLPFQMLYDFSSFHRIQGSPPGAHANILLATCCLGAFLMGTHPVPSLAVGSQYMPTCGFPRSLFFLYHVLRVAFPRILFSALFSFWVLLS